MDGLADGRTDGRKDGRTDGRTGGRTGGVTDGRGDGRTERLTDGVTVRSNSTLTSIAQFFAHSYFQPDEPILFQKVCLVQQQ